MEDFVTFEIAKKLKEKGFIEGCFATYSPYSKTLKLNEIDVDKRPTSYKLNITEFRECYNRYVENNIDAPTISQVLKWLREEKKLFVYISMAYNKYYVGICKTDEFDEVVGLQVIEHAIGTPINTYEQAAIAGIEYVVDNLI